MKKGKGIKELLSKDAKVLELVEFQLLLELSFDRHLFLIPLFHHEWRVDGWCGFQRLCENTLGSKSGADKDHRGF